jgi:hypothetical protein
VESERVVGHPAAARQLSGSASFSESRSGKIGHISFGVKQTRKPSAGNLHAGFDEAGTGNQLTVWLVRHSQRKRRETDRPNLRSMAPVLDPTSCAVPARPERHRHDLDPTGVRNQAHEHRSICSGCPREENDRLKLRAKSRAREVEGIEQYITTLKTGGWV